MEKKNKTQEINKKLEYIGLDLKAIPETLKLVEDMHFKPNVGFDEKKYRQYRFISPKELEILLSPTNRLDDIKDKYLQASPLADYLDSKNEENQEKHETFLRMLDEVKISDIEKIEQEQQQINKKIPFKVRYSGNYLWQIYYSEENDKYFMIVPTEDKDYSTFFYVLKKQIEKKKAGKVFVPISNVDYSRELLNKTEIQSLENYLWLFTKDWPSIYEVYDKTEKVSLQIVGETEVYGKIKSEYKKTYLKKAQLDLDVMRDGSRTYKLALKHLGEENAKLYKAIMENNVGMFEWDDSGALNIVGKWMFDIMANWKDYRKSKK